MADQPIPPGLHPATAAILRHFRADHLPPGPLRDTSLACQRLAFDMAVQLPADPEVTAGLRHLLEAKDSFVRAVVPTQHSLRIGAEATPEHRYGRVVAASCSCGVDYDIGEPLLPQHDAHVEAL